MDGGPAPPVAVVGAGLAGLTAALDLARAGRRVLLIERRPYAGGKAFSFRDPLDGAELDNGQHVTMRCCTALHALLEQGGAAGLVRYQPALRVPVLDPRSGRAGAISSAPRLPAPFHLAPSILRYPHLGMIEKAALGRALVPMARIARRGGALPDDETFAGWLRRHGQGERAIAEFWDLIIRPTCNDRCDAVSAAQAFQVFRDGLLADPHAAGIGLFRGGLSAISDAVLRRFAEHGGQTLFECRVRGVRTAESGALRVELGGAGPIEAAAIVLALPPAAAAALLPAEWRMREPFDALDRFATSPIVNVHMRWDRGIAAEPITAVLDDRLQFVFARPAPEGGQWLTASLSAAREQAAMPQDEVAAGAERAVRGAWPAAREAALIRWRVIKERDATFRPLPGIAAARPGPATPIPGLVLAGAWTDTGWPATLESAVRSGRAAAAEVERQLAGA